MDTNNDVRKPYVQRLAFTDPRDGIRKEFYAKDCHDNTIRDAIKELLGIENLEDFISCNFRFHDVV